MCRKKRLALKRVKGTITQINDEIVIIVEKFHNDVYKCENQRESKLPGQRKIITEAEEMIPMMTEEGLLAIRCMKKGKCLSKYRKPTDLIKEEGQEFVKMLAILFFECLEKSEVPEDRNNAVML